MTSTYRQDLPEEFKALLELWKDIKSFVGPEFESDIQYFDNALKTGSWAWDPVLESRHPKDIDRLGEVLLGPVFASAKHPWPIKDGLPMIPLLQLDLDKASGKGGINIATGLLQAFVAINDTLGQRVRVRTIERTDVAVEALLPAPPFTEVTETFASVDWAKPNLAADESPCLQIVQYEPKRFSFSPPSPLSNRFNFQKYSPDQQIKMCRFDEMLEDDLSEFSGGGFHLLGTFQPIQYTQIERSWPLFSLESEYGFNFSDGQGQVFFETDESGEISFYFDWSCF
jgi:hypothetical protein